MVDAFEDTKLTLRRTRQPITGFRRCGSGVRVDPYPSGNARTGVLRGKVLPVVAFGYDLPKFVVSSSTSPAGRSDTSLLHRSLDCASCVDIHGAGATEAEVAGAP